MAVLRLNDAYMSFCVVICETTGRLYGCTLVAAVFCPAYDRRGSEIGEEEPAPIYSNPRPMLIGAGVSCIPSGCVDHFAPARPTFDWGPGVIISNAL